MANRTRPRRSNARQLLHSIGCSQGCARICGHPAPLLVRGGQATELDPPEPAPPLGLGPRPEPLRLRLALGDRILLYTDGASEARARGRYFPLQTAAAFALVSADLQAGLESLWAELQRHVAGQLHDDIALLLIEHSR